MSSEETKIFIGKVPRKKDEKDLREAFKEYGEIKKVELKNNHAIMVRMT